jgi:hypothetical protein
MNETHAAVPCPAQEMAASDNPTLAAKQLEDPTLFCTGYVAQK